MIENYKIEGLELVVQQWADARGIYKHSTVEAQTLKAVSEMGELADAVVKRDQAAIRDAIGDVMVCLINIAYMRELTLRECLTCSYEEIKDRKGKMVQGGVFVKE